MNTLFAIFGKLVLIFGVIFVLIGIGFYFGRVTAPVEQKATVINQDVLVSPTGEASSQIQPTSSIPVQVGSIEGTLGYPSSGIPPLMVYAFDANNNTIHFQVKTGQDQGTFVMNNIPAGSYFVVAYPDAYAVSGGYTKAVACGLTVACTDHSLIPVVVKSGEKATGIEVKDWYAPEGTFPAKP